MYRILFACLVLPVTLLIVACDSDNPVEPEPTATEHVQFIRDFEYDYPRIIDLGTPVELSSDDSIVMLLVFHEEEIARDPSARYTHLRINPTGSPAAHDRLLGMVEIAPEQYVYFPSGEGTFGHTLVFAQRQVQKRAVGAFYIVHRKDALGNLTAVDTVGDLFSDTLTLKQLFDGLDDDPGNPSWSLMWRNCYRMPLNLPVEDLSVRVCLAPPGAEDTAAADDILSPASDTSQHWPFVTVVGLDQYNESGQRLPDGFTDDREETFRSDWGLLIFPHRRPFDTDTAFISSFGVATPPLETLVPDLYDYTSITQKVSASQYYLQLQWVTWE